MQDAQRVLVVDNEEGIRRLLSESLRKAGYEVVEAVDGAAAIKAIDEHKPDLVILDVMLPVMDGHEVLHMLRSYRDTSRMPVIMLTAGTADADKTYGLEIGADDYMSKPFGISELMARVRALLRRAMPQVDGIVAATATLEVGSIRIDKSGRRAYSDGRELLLTLKEYDLLSFLMQNQGIAFSREKLLGEVWGYDYFGDLRTVDVHITHLRSKIGFPGADMIETVRGIGYRMNPQG